MKISCILASYNRPTLIRQALQSIQDQTHPDYELIVVDDSSKMDIFEVAKGFKFTHSKIMHLPVKPEDRAKVNRLGVNINIGLAHATGDLICYLADDDYYFPTWFEKASRYFETHSLVQVGFGILKYSESREMVLAEMGEIRFWDEIIKDPMGRLDHNQVIHRRFDPIQKWQEGVGTEMSVDGWFFSQLANFHDFHPINAWAAVKRLHGKNLQNHVSLYQSGKMDDLRE
jgi:spore maturation protein CgeD